MSVKGPTVNTAGLTSAQNRLAIEYAGTEADARMAVSVMTWFVERANQATKQAEDALRAAAEAKRAFSRAVPDWRDRVTEEDDGE